MNEKEEFEAILDVFTMDGWKLIINDITELRDSMDSVQNIGAVEQFWETKGELKQLNYFLALEEFYKQCQDSPDDDV